MFRCHTEIKEKSFYQVIEVFGLSNVISSNESDTQKTVSEFNGNQNYTRVRNLKFATYLKFATCENTNKIHELW